MSNEEKREERGRKTMITRTQNNESIWRFPEPDNILRFAEEGELLSARITLTRPVNVESLLRLEAQDEQLFPGLSNEIVLEQIVPKLSWRAFHILSFVNRSWRQAIRSHQVFDARVRSHSTESLLLLDFSHWIGGEQVCVHAFCLYSVTEKTWHRLPHFPHQREAFRGIPSQCGCVALDGKVYVLGGASWDNGTSCTDSREMYVLDLAGQTGWKQCADMLESRQDFAYGVIDGKIYVAGGISCGKTIRRSEVYDPKENSWSTISPMISTRADHKFGTVGKELRLYGGLFYDRDCEIFRSGVKRPEDDPSITWRLHEGRSLASFREVYHASTGEWESVNPFEDRSTEVLFAAQGKVFSMDPDIIYVKDCDDDEDRTKLYSFSFSGVESPESVYFQPFAVCSVNNELFALAHYPTEQSVNDEISLLQSRGFGSENDQIVWEIVFSDEHYLPELAPDCGNFSPIMCPVQL